MSERKITLGDALLQYTMREFGKKEGADSFDQFVQAASTSHIPVEFTEASGNVSDQVTADLRQRGIDDVDEVWKAQAGRLFETDFSNIDEAIYACQYSQAIALVKRWSATDNQFSPFINVYQSTKEAVEKSYSGIAARLGCEPSRVREELVVFAQKYDRSILDDIDTVEARANSMKATVDQVSQLLGAQRVLAEQACGMVVINEGIAEGKNRTPVQKAKLRAKQALGKRATFSDYARVRETVEKYFADPQKVARIQILAESRRK